MEKNHRNPETKTAALKQLGVASTRKGKALSGQVEFVRTTADRQLLARGTFMRNVLVGVSGAVIVSDANGSVSQLTAPFVIDLWACDDRRVAEVSVITQVDTALVLVDCRRRSSVFEALPVLDKLSNRSHAVLRATVDVIDLTQEDAKTGVAAGNLAEPITN